MTTIELKQQLISQIQISDDPELLEWMLGLLAKNPTETEIYALNADQIATIERAEEQIKHGDYYTEEEADKMTEEWLKK